METVSNPWKMSGVDVLSLLGSTDTAITMCMDNNVPIIIFSMNKTGNIKRVVLGEKIGTVVEG